MKPIRFRVKSANGERIASLRLLSTLLLALPLLLALTLGASAQGTSARGGVHVYLVRGLMNVFSLGMDEIASKLQAQGIHATVHNHMVWSSLADEAAAEYKSGKTRTIILVGHSAGAAAIASMATRLGQLGVPVKLAISLDPVTRQTVSGHVGRYVNYYVGNGAGEPVSKGSKFSGSLQNVDVKSNPNLGHFNIDKDQALQQKVIRAIRAAL